MTSESSNRMMRFWSSRGTDGPYSETTQGMDGNGTSSGEAMGLPNDPQLRDWIMRERYRRMGMDPDQMMTLDMMGGRSSNRGGVIPIQWADTSEGGKGGGGGLGGILKMFGGGG